DEVVRRPLRRGELRHLGEHLLDLRARHALVAREEVHLGAVEVDRGVGRELERVVLDLDLRAVTGLREAAERRLETSLADVAPGARDVGPDVDLHGGGRRIRRGRAVRGHVTVQPSGGPHDSPQGPAHRVTCAARWRSCRTMISAPWWTSPRFRCATRCTNGACASISVAWLSPTANAASSGSASTPARQRSTSCRSPATAAPTSPEKTTASRRRSCGPNVHSHR